MKQFLSWGVLMLLFVVQIQAQKADDPVLFTVNGVQVHTSEFSYIYAKTNGANANFSKNSLQEYLDLYVKFKLKVQRAREMKLDTISSLQQELAGYRRQLADSYLMDKEVTEKLAEEAYKRSQEDIDISQIFIAATEEAPAADTLAAFQSIMDAKKQLESGTDFATVARAFSKDKSVTENGGRVGFVTALFPKGFYALESAAYEGPLGKIQGPIRTSAGYHLLKVNAKRPARGEIEVSHILIRNGKEGEIKDAKSKIDSIHVWLTNGQDFAELARRYSEDKVTGPKDGYIGFFGINRYERAFEDAAFAVTKDGAFSAPVETSIGWHIIRRVSYKGNEPYETAKLRLATRIKADTRYEIARKAMVERIKKGANFTVNTPNMDAFKTQLGEDFLTYKWKNVEKGDANPLFTMGGNKVTQGQFVEYLNRNSRERIRMAQNTDIETAMNTLFAGFVDEQVMSFEERRLEEKYPDFKALMREYEEGILLFEATKMEVWDKASSDTLGLEAFFNTQKGKYNWDERARVSIYTLKESAKTQLEEVRRMSSTMNPQDVEKRFNTGEEKVLSHIEDSFEKGRNETLDKMKWEVGQLSAFEVNPRDKSANWFKIEEVIPPGPKTLKDARGYVIADYQDKLEKEWVETLRKKYKVDIDQKVFNKMVK